jgi:hypothetical protein
MVQENSKLVLAPVEFPTEVLDGGNNGKELLIMDFKINLDEVKLMREEANGIKKTTIANLRDNIS